MTGEEPDSVDAGAKALDIEATQDDIIIGARLNYDSIGAGHENARFESLGADRDRLGDRDGAEAAGIQNVDFAAGRGLRDRAREGLAWRGAATRIGIVTDAGNPSAGRLRLRGGTGQGKGQAEPQQRQ